MAIQIYGAGMAGLLAAQMLRRHDPVVCELAPKLPDNHGALLRFRTDAVARAVHQDFKRVTVSKGVCIDGVVLDRATIPDTNRYSYKVTGSVMPRSIMNLDTVERYIAPDNFISELGRYCNIQYGYGATRERIDAAHADGTAIISTIPMPALMSLLLWPERPVFKALPIWSITATIIDPVTEVYQTLYYPHTEDVRYRASITGNKIIVECTKEVREDAVMAMGLLRQTLDEFGIASTPNVVEIKTKHQPYGKLLPVDERIRREFILWATDHFGVYSLGRFATWRQLLLDDVVKDVAVVDRFISSRDSYTRRVVS